jgi:hypothetical protein
MKKRVRESPMEMPREVEDIFQKGAEEIFNDAKIYPHQYPAVFKETKEILFQAMENLSRKHGLSYKRVTLYNEQKAILLTDLLRLKAEGKIEGYDDR